MKDLATNHQETIENQDQLSTTSSAEQLSLLLTTRDIQWTGMGLTLPKREIPIIRQDSDLYQELMIREKLLLNQLKPAKPSEIIGLLSRLRLHYPLANIESKEVRLLLSDYLEDLRSYPFDLISATCREYRQNPQNRFFPKIGELLKPVIDKWYQRRWQLTQVKILIAKANIGKELDYLEHRQMATNVQKEVETLIRELQEKA